jgi:hypothetical protein
MAEWQLVGGLVTATYELVLNLLSHSQARVGPVVCRSVPCVGALATYDLPVRAPPAAPEWLVACISDAAKHLDQAPFLQLQLPGGVGRMQRHRVTHAVVQAPQARGSPETSAARLLAAASSLAPLGLGSSPAARTGRPTQVCCA